MGFDWSKHAAKTGEWVKFDQIDDKVVGRIVSIREHTFPGDDEATVIVDLDTGEDETRSLSCAALNLRQQMADLNPQVGDKVGVKFVGTQKLPGRPQPMKLFDVRVMERAKPPEPDQYEDGEEPF